MRLLAAAAIALALLLSGCGETGYTVAAESMEPTLVKGDHITADDVDGDYEPRAGDVVVYRDPGGWLGPIDGPAESRGNLIHRVIGTPGDELVCCDTAGRLSVNGQALDEAYLAPDPGACNATIYEWATSRSTDLKAPCDWKATVPEGKVFVMGDNRGHAADSRAHFCGPDQGPCEESPWVDVQLVRGVVDVR